MGEMEDIYDDEFDSDEEIFEAGSSGGEDNEDGDEMDTEQKALDIIEKDKSLEREDKQPVQSKVYLPNRSQLGPDEVMEADQSVYEMLHTVNLKWPCLSFDIIEDNLGDERRNYPQTTYIVGGTQAQKSKDNEILVMKLSSLSKTQQKDEEDESDDEDEYDSDPILESKSLPTPYTTNRIRVSPHAKQTGEYLTASMSESGEVFIWDISPHFRFFDTPGSVITKPMNKPIHTIKEHRGVEGYALDWSPFIQTGSLLTGDTEGKIFLTNRRESGWVTDKQAFLGHQGSVEELQWSKSEKTVFASGGTDGFVKIWDTRSKKHAPVISIKASNTDVNVMSWNSKVSYLLATGYDDGQWGVWDLRSFKPNTTPAPVASFDFHRSPITSIEFHPTEDSIVAVGSEDNTVTLWDLAVEADDEEIKTQADEANGDLEGIPPQLLFVHWQKDAKEVHWHKQIPGALVSTGGDGMSIWKSISV
ncbi:WD40 repeat-like protein [Nadsonia fulvescens var. elongata DSM 6958]|uniref:WD40 repeat-like protein n=1 Tax=Nadsonia fulvescens var. elongata DSM 6958 TaxID=857566 RepID=A0A1E3PR84_9ASCO|nr:WD40 repeat-like protein [Nadsonia fulvescens var. elongata DSM 6958]